MKIIKHKKNVNRFENHENHRIPLQNHPNHENLRNS